MSLKQDILFELEKNRGADTSGQSLAERFGVSRTAVWKAVQALRAEGHDVLSGLNRGYRLSENDDRLSPAGVAQALLPEYRSLPVRVYHTLDSTNLEAARLLSAGEPCPMLVLSEEQTAGRGRLGRTFYSPEGTGLYMTLVLRPHIRLSEAALLTTAAAVAVVQAVEALTDNRPAIKWVNDVYLGDRKLCGILTEATGDFETGSVENVRVGIGVNVRTRDFPSPLNRTACSLDRANTTRNRLAAEIVNRLLPLAARLPDRAFLEDYREHSLVIGREVAFSREGQTRRALAVAIDDAGGLVLRHADGSLETLRAGEISVQL